MFKVYEGIEAYKVEGSENECRLIVDGKEVSRKILVTAAGQNLVQYKLGIYEIKWNNQYPNISYKVTFIKTLAEHEEEIKGLIKPKLHTDPIAPPPTGKIQHSKYNHLKTCVDNDIPVYLVGPAGSGKNFTLEEIANEMGLDFYFTNSVQQEFKITGFIDAGGKYHETGFYKAFTNGGLFFLDEMDASIPEVLVLLNAAIANKYFEFPTGRVQAHDNFRVVAAGNTVGSGADEQYTGRLVLDQATLDRFIIIEFDYDKNIELVISGGNIELVEFIRQLREKASQVGVRATFSYRAITMVTKLEGKLPLKDIMYMAVFKGMDQDTINTLKVHGYTEYHKAI